jgi:hypothetical protein
MLWLDPMLFGVVEAHASPAQLADHVALVWLLVAAAGIAFRCIQLCVTRSVLTGIAWVSKIATEPFHNIRIYWRSPVHLLRGQLYDPLDEVAHMAPRSPARS